eukprot:scaffold264226_cov28-Prasinocladus_malaysianus.AAC.1
MIIKTPGSVSNDIKPYYSYDETAPEFHVANSKQPLARELTAILRAPGGRSCNRAAYPHAHAAAIQLCVSALLSSAVV